MIKFLQDSHQYFHENGTEFISVSELFKKFEPFVDWNKIALKFAKKQTELGNPMTKEDVLKAWKEKANKSSEVGSLFHSIQEQRVISQPSIKLYDQDCNIKSCLYNEKNEKLSIPITKLENNMFYPELMIYDEEYNVCGQSDKVIVVDNKIHIWDYKTDKEIKFVGFSSKWQSPLKLLPPLSHLDSCNGNQYAIKMSMYMYMLWKANKGRFKTGDLIIEHVSLKRDENDIPVIGNDGNPVVLKIEEIKIPYLKKEVENIFKTLKK